MELQPLIDAINDRTIVSGLTHDIYRYPARYSPVFARAAIELFTKSGDTVLDPFMGGSTSLVEAAALGRNVIGTDINELSVFLARVKTLLFSDTELRRLSAWATATVPDLSPVKPVVRHSNWKDLGYQVNLPWRFRKVAEQALNSAADSLCNDLLVAARCIVLKTVQWAVDCKKFLPTAAAFRSKIVADTEVVVSGLREYRDRIEQLPRKPHIEAYHSAADDIIAVPSDALRKRRPKLVITSPPYPGVHVLYHRWQVLGRRETPAPYWITASNDGQGASYYTFCDRRRPDHDALYFRRLQKCFTAIRQVVSDKCIVAQLVGFSQPDEQLPRYLAAMSAAGFEELRCGPNGRRLRRDKFWRAVPNRKFYVWLRDNTRQTREILLLHRATSS